MDGWFDEWMEDMDQSWNGWMERWMNNECMLYEWMEGWINWGMDAWMD